MCCHSFLLQVEPSVWVRNNLIFPSEFGTMYCSLTPSKNADVAYEESKNNREDTGYPTALATGQSYGTTFVLGWPSPMPPQRVWQKAAQ